MVSVRKNYNFKKWCPPKISGYGPDIYPIENSINSLEHVAEFTDNNIQKRLALNFDQYKQRSYCVIYK